MRRCLLYGSLLASVRAHGPGSPRRPGAEGDLGSRPFLIPGASSGCQRIQGGCERLGRRLTPGISHRPEARRQWRWHLDGTEARGRSAASGALGRAEDIRT